MNKVGPDPTPLIELSIGNWGAQVLFTANRLDIFEICAAESLDAASIAKKIGSEVRPTELFLNACASLGLLEKTDNCFRNTELANVFLNRNGPGYMGNAIRYSDNLYSTWAELEKALLDGQPVMAAESYLGQDPDQTRDFVFAMHDRAMGTARALVHLVDLGGRTRMLDVGGGPGTYSVLFAERYPNLHAEIIELPAVAAIGAEIIESMGYRERVSTIEGNYHEISFPGDKDVVLISGVFHRESASGCRKLIRRSLDVLEEGGMLVVSDVFTDEDHAGPTLATLFGLNMFLTAPEGGVHADASVVAWMKDAGFGEVNVRRFPPPMPHRIIYGIKQ